MPTLTPQRTSMAMQQTTTTNLSVRKNADIAHVSSSPHVEENKPHPEMINFAFADIPVADMDHKIVKALFAPDSLTPSNKTDNISTHFSIDDWMYLLVTLNSTSVEATESLTTSTYQEGGGRNIESRRVKVELQGRLEKQMLKLEEAMKKISDEIEGLTQESNEIKTGNRYYLKNEVERNKVQENDKKIKELKKQKKSHQHQLKALKKHAEIGFKALTKLVNDFMEAKSQSTILILRLIKTKFALSEKDFYKDLDSILNTTTFSWPRISRETLNLVNEMLDENHSFSFEPYQFQHGLSENEWTYADCVETSIRNFLAIVTASKPEGHTNESWFKELDIHHLLINKNDEPNDLFETLEGDDSHDKHAKFASILREQSHFSPERRDNGCIVSEKHLFDNLKLLLKINPLHILDKCGLDYTSSDQLENLSEIEILTVNISKTVKIEISNSHNHAEFSKEISPPSFFLSNLDPKTVDDISPLLLLSCSRETLLVAFYTFWNEPSTMYIPTLDHWSKLINTIPISTAQRILPLSDEQKVYLQKAKEEKINIFLAIRTAAFANDQRKLLIKAKAAGFNDFSSETVSSLDHKTAMNAIEAKNLHFDDGDAIEIAKFKPEQRALGFKAIEDGFSSYAAFKIATDDAFHDRCYKAVNSGIKPALAGHLAISGNDMVDIAIKAKKMALQDHELIAIAGDNIDETPERIETALKILEAANRKKKGDITPYNVMKIVNLGQEKASFAILMIGKLIHPKLNDLLETATSENRDAIFNDVCHAVNLGFTVSSAIKVANLHSENRKKCFQAKAAKFADSEAIKFADFTDNKLHRAIRAKKAGFPDSECIALAEKPRMRFEFALRKKGLTRRAHVNAPMNL